jgi:hypothetical protein
LIEKKQQGIYVRTINSDNLQQSIRQQTKPGIMQISLSSIALDITRYWQEISMLNLYWNSVISNLSGAKLLDLLQINEFQILAPQYLTHYSHD